MQHNPVSVAIESIQQQWTEQTESHEGFKVARWLIREEETALINGFLKLESSPHGQCDDFFIVLLTPYVYDMGAYSIQLVRDLFRMWDEDSYVKEQGREWDRASFIPRLEDVDKADKLLCDVLDDFNTHFCRDEQRLVLGLLPSTIEEISDYNDWIARVANMLPEQVAICLVDYNGSENFKNSIEQLNDKAITLKCSRFDMQQMASDILSSQQDPENPQVVFQQCVLQMGKATGNKSISSLQTWGTKAIKAATQSGSQSLLATAYLVYAGFMMQFKNKGALELLNKGQSLAQMAITNKEAEASTVQMQIYGYYSAYYSIMGDRKSSCEWSLKQAAFAGENDMKVYAISIYRHTAQLSASSYTTIRKEALAKGYAISEGLTDEELRASEIQMVAFHYMNELYEADDLQQVDNVSQRMSALLGDSWKEGIPSLKDKHAQMNTNFTS